MQVWRRLLTKENCKGKERGNGNEVVATVLVSNMRANRWRMTEALRRRG
jgi:hypothetical protein